MKAILLFISIVFFLSSKGQAPNFVISLTANGLDSGYQKLTLTQILSANESAVIYTDSLSKEKNRVVIKGYVPEERYVYLTLRRFGALDLGIGPGDTAHIEWNKKQSVIDFDISGSNKPVQSANYINRIYDRQSNLLEVQRTRMDSLNIAEAPDEEIQRFRQRYDSIYQALFIFNTRYADTVGSAVAAAIALIRYKYEPSKYKVLPHISKAIERFDSLPTLTSLIVDDSQKNAIDPFAVRKDSIDIVAAFSPSMVAAVSQIARENKLVLIDFWASWCTPCIEEFPYLDSAYRQFSGKQFEIISVSLDADRDAWEQAKARLKTSWPYHFIESDAMDSPPAKALKIKSIPRNYLIDSKGRVYGKNLRKKQLTEILSQLL